MPGSALPWLRGPAPAPSAPGPAGRPSKSCARRPRHRRRPAVRRPLPHVNMPSAGRGPHSHAATLLGCRGYSCGHTLQCSWRTGCTVLACGVCSLSGAGWHIRRIAAPQHLLMHSPAVGASQQTQVPSIQRGNALADSTTPRSSRPSVRRASPALGCSITSGARSTATSCAHSELVEVKSRRKCVTTAISTVHASAEAERSEG